MNPARRGRPWFALGLVAALSGAACSASRGTERVFHGQPVQGRYIQPEAYAAYTEGAYCEAQGDWAGAERAYRRALQRDGQSPEILTRLAALACRQSTARALRLFDRAIALEDFAPAWTERARCLASQQRPAVALQAALHSVRLEPLAADANLLVARLYREAARPELARTWLFAWLLLEPELEDSAAQLRHEGELLGDALLSRLIDERLAQSRPWDAGARARDGHRPPPAALLAAIRAGKAEAARDLAAGARITPLELSLLATSNAQPELGLAQAELLLEANPRDSAALVAGLLAAAQLGDPEPMRRLLRKAEGAVAPPPELARSLGELLRARVSDEAAERWYQAYGRSRPRAGPVPAP